MLTTSAMDWSASHETASWMPCRLASSFRNPSERPTSCPVSPSPAELAVSVNDTTFGAVMPTTGTANRPTEPASKMTSTEYVPSSSGANVISYSTDPAPGTTTAPAGSTAKTAPETTGARTASGSAGTMGRP